MKSPHRSRSRGLFGRLLIIFIGLLLGIISSFAVSFHLFSKGERKNLLINNLENYGRFLAKDFGLPPDAERIQTKATELGLIIGVYGQDLVIKTSDRVPELQLLEDSRQSKLHKKGQQWVNIKEGAYHYVFSFDRSRLSQTPWSLVVALLISIFLVILAYHLIDRLFKPILTIQKAAEEFSNGNFSHEFDVQGVGLLGDLSSSVKVMGLKIESMLDAKRELLLAIAHELRTPLTRAKLHLEMTEDLEIKEKLSLEIEEMSHLVSDLLEAEQLKDGHKVLDREDTLIEDLVSETFSRFYKDNSQVRLIIEGDKIHSIDRRKYSLVIKNLVDNALLYGGGKDIEVVLRGDSLSVIDYGQGIPEEEIKNLTEAFYRVNKSRERSTGGIGLGLYLVQQVVKAHGHRLEITSNTRTEFKIYF